MHFSRADAQVHTFEDLLVLFFKLYLQVLDFQHGFLSFNRKDPAWKTHARRVCV